MYAMCKEQVVSWMCLVFGVVRNDISFKVKGGKKRSIAGNTIGFLVQISQNTVLKEKVSLYMRNRKTGKCVGSISVFLFYL